LRDLNIIDTNQQGVETARMARRQENYGQGKSLLRPQRQFAERLVRRSQEGHVCEETDDDVVLIKDRRGRVIGFERLNYLTAKQRKEDVSIPVEVQMV